MLEVTVEKPVVTEVTFKELKQGEVFVAAEDLLLEGSRYLDVYILSVRPVDLMRTAVNLRSGMSWIPWEGLKVVKMVGELQVRKKV